MIGLLIRAEQRCASVCSFAVSVGSASGGKTEASPIALRFPVSHLSLSPADDGRTRFVGDKSTLGQSNLQKKSFSGMTSFFLLYTAADTMGAVFEDAVYTLYRRFAVFYEVQLNPTHITFYG